jgi:hypothetical protein
LFAVAAVIAPVGLWPQDKDAAMPALSDAEKEAFLLKAKIVRTRGVSTGITGTRRMTLSDGKLTHDASFQTINEMKPSFQTARGTELNFKDSYKYNIAAYRLDRLMNLNMIPVSVERRVAGHSGSMTWWVDNVQMMELNRFEKNITPPDQDAWNDQMYQARIFNELVYNTDANLGNIQITHDWRIWLIDFSRGFRTHKKLRAPENLQNCVIDPRFLSGMKGLTEDGLKKAMKDLLTGSEISGLLARRDVIVEHFNGLIASQGEKAAVCDRPGH